MTSALTLRGFNVLPLVAAVSWFLAACRFVWQISKRIVTTDAGMPASLPKDYIQH